MPEFIALRRKGLNYEVVHLKFGLTFRIRENSERNL
jgi:hypothetical protein